jgi:hypothetical protein
MVAANQNIMDLMKYAGQKRKAGGVAPPMPNSVYQTFGGAQNTALQNQQVAPQPVTPQAATQFTPPAAKPVTPQAITPPAATQGVVPPQTPSPYTPDQMGHQAWINNPNSGFGGMDSYTSMQQNKFNTASQSNDADMLGRLDSDMARVGYSLQPYQAAKPVIPQPVTPPMPQQGVAPPMPDAVTNVRSSSDLQQSSGDSLAIERASLKNAIDTSMQGLRNNASYSNQLMRDNRSLEDAKLSRQLNPFSGRTTYAQREVTRGREIDDSARASQLDNQLNAYTQELMNFDRLSPERQRQIYNELLEKERNFGINQAGVTGNYAGQRTLAGKAQDYAQDPSNPQNAGQLLQNQIAQLKLTQLPQEMKLGLDALEQDLKTGKINQESAEYQLKQLQDPQSVLNRSKALEMQMKELEAKNLPERERLEMQKLRKSIAEIGKEQPKSAYEEKLAEANMLKVEAEIERLKNPPAEKPAKFNTTLANTLKNTYVSKNVMGQDVVDKAGLRKAILAAINDDAEIDQMLGFFGLEIMEE